MSPSVKTIHHLDHLDNLDHLDYLDYLRKYVTTYMKPNIHCKIIPDICLFFYTGKIFGKQSLHRKTPIFRVKSVKKRHFFA